MIPRVLVAGVCNRSLGSGHAIGYMGAWVNLGAHDLHCS